MRLNPKPIFLMFAALLLVAALAACQAGNGQIVMPKTGGKICMDLKFVPSEDGTEAPEESVEGGGQVCMELAPNANGQLAPVAPMDGAAILDAERNSTVTVFTEVGHGSGVIFDSMHVLTAKHVAKAGEKVRVLYRNDDQAVGVVEWDDPELDFSVIKLSFPAPFPAPELRCAVPEVGEPIVAVGTPMQRIGTVIHGYVAAVNDGDWRVLIDGSMNPGMSGGPIFDSAGRVIGISHAYISTNFSGSQSGIGIMLSIEPFCKSNHRS